ncbi:oxidative stress survival, Svf1-like protein [Basidiobolus meristosporus CBS 931.73]|uniref:Oxidative stress survival, Svf1-like protein n=1 Tax=Basidiobolus meristosporus CBS 931.73 TaxID=1314790 RepID=A0A1Y1XZR4_9FUNG|nr:oxidative stress survival, Svf1-like protein [Basidiobolus meristosporus CBS 931.73]|eukprot:ORX91247.1 oxidative stress survival, Svf1-like protein [Basidiobolus meristosporus CBS 931.73]
MSTPIYLACDIAEEKNIPLVSQLGCTDLKWTLAGGSSTESATFYIKLDDGGLLFVQLAHSNIGLSPTVQTTAQYFNGEVHKFETANRSARTFQASSDKGSVSVEGMTIVNNEEDSRLDVLITFDTLEIKFNFSIVDCGFQIGEGKTYFGELSPSSFICHQSFPKGTVRGTIKYDDETRDIVGEGYYIHAVLSMKPHEVATKCNLITLQSGDNALSLLHFDTPESFDFIPVTQASLILNRKLVAVTVKNTAQFISTSTDPENGYEVPSEVHYTMDGDTLDGRPFHCEATIKLTSLLMKVDVLSELPYILRKIIQYFFTKPYIYQFFDDAEVTATIGDEEVSFGGKAFFECSFLN